MKDYAVSTAFIAKDKISKAFKKMERAAYKFGKTSEGSFSKASKSGRNFIDVAKGVIVANSIQKSLALTTRSAYNVAESFVTFDDAVYAATARFKDMGPASKNIKRNLDVVANAARGVGATTQFTSTQAAQGLDMLARAGFDSVNAIKALRPMVDLATATGEDFSIATSYSVDLLGAFGLAADDSAKRLKNLNRLNDVLVYTANSANVTLEDLFEAMKGSAQIATQLGYKLETVASMTAMLGNMGLKGSVGLTIMKNAMLRLVDPRVQKILKANHIEISNGQGGMRKYSAILLDIAKRINGLGTPKQARILNDIFGLRAVAGVSGVMRKLDEMDAFEDKLYQVQGVSKQTALLIRQSWGNQLAILKSSLMELGFNFLNAFSKNGKQGVAELIVAIRKFDVTPIVDGVKTAWKVIKGLYGVIKPFAWLIPYIIGWFVAYKTIMAGLGIYAKVKDFGLLVGILYKLAGAVGALNATMLANPITWIVAGIVALGGLFYWLEKKFKLFSTVWKYWSKVFGWGDDKKLVKVDYSKFSQQTLPKGVPQVPTSIKRGDPSAWGFDAPNAKEAMARQSQINGRLDIYGAPEGSTLTTSGSAAPLFDMSLLGAAQ